MGLSNPFKRKSKEIIPNADPKINAAVEFMTDKTNTYTKAGYIMSKKDRYEFDLIREIMTIIRTN